MPSLLPVANQLDRLHQLLEELERAKPYRDLPLPDAFRYPDMTKWLERCRTKKDADGWKTVPRRLPRRLRKQIAQIVRDNRKLEELNRAAQQCAHECIQSVQEAQSVLQPDVTASEYRGLMDALEGIKAALNISFCNCWGFKGPQVGKTMSNGRSTPKEMLHLWTRRRTIIVAMRARVRRLWEQGTQLTEERAGAEAPAPSAPVAPAPAPAGMAVAGKRRAPLAAARRPAKSEMIPHAEAAAIFAAAQGRKLRDPRDASKMMERLRERLGPKLRCKRHGKAYRYDPGDCRKFAALMKPRGRNRDAGGGAGQGADTPPDGDFDGPPLPRYRCVDPNCGNKQSTNGTCKKCKKGRLVPSRNSW
jgi:hypothetical protein